ncbi:MAG: methylated-DNA--[protein]-cysteine S-methyltransferase [Verrucomicrobiota bacterium]|jgi:O-6-methylguanine DNA methyltransferase
MKAQFVKLPIFTSDGQFVAHYSENGLAELNFPQAGTPRCGVRTSQLVAPKHSEGGRVPTKVRNWYQATAAALKNILAGRSPGKFPPLDLSNGTTFQRKVWNTLRKIARGQTKSYGEIARAIGRPRAVRAVGSACGANPIPVLVPCHRVLAANGKLGGFSGGLNWKRKLLTREGAMFWSGGTATPPGMLAAQQRGPTFDFRQSAG